jgi:predicted metal-binding membrane protein
VIAVDSLLRHERTLTTACLAVVVLLAWAYIWHGAGMGMTARDMTVLTLFPHTIGEPMPDMVMPEITWMTIIAMWWVMMIAMMTPSAAPLILLYDRVLRHSRSHRMSPQGSTLALTAGYLCVWLAFSVAAAGIQFILQRAGLISEMMLWSKSAWLSGMVLVITGIYQLSPLKRACLRRCRNPVQMLTRWGRPGRVKAWRMGVEHGMWCVACCWLLMALLFVGGVMNVAWIALISLFVLAEKILGAGPSISRLSGILLICWGIATLLV